MPKKEVIITITAMPLKFAERWDNALDHYAASEERAGELEKRLAVPPGPAV